MTSFMLPEGPYEATPFQWQTQAWVEERDRLLPGDVFTLGVRKTLYRYALIRNSWGTTNLDAGPIGLERVSELYEAHARGSLGANRVLPSEREVLNYFALVDDLPTSPFLVSVEDVRLLHQDYFRDVPLQNGAKPGHWKDRDNVVASPWRVVKTSPKERVEADLEALLARYDGSAGALPLVARVALVFHGFQRIHPFGDGNGRVGRLAALMLLTSGGLEAARLCPVDDAINEDRHEYHLALARADEGDVSYWVDYFGAQVRSGYQRALLLGRRLQRIPPRVPEGSRLLLEHLYVHRIASFRLADVRGFYLHESQRTIIRRLKELEDLGFLAREGSGAGSRYRARSLHEIETGIPEHA